MCCDVGILSIPGRRCKAGILVCTHCYIIVGSCLLVRVANRESHFDQFQYTPPRLVDGDKTSFGRIMRTSLFQASQLSFDKVTLCLSQRLKGFKRECKGAIEKKMGIFWWGFRQGQPLWWEKRDWASATPTPHPDDLHDKAESLRQLLQCQCGIFIVPFLRPLFPA